MKVCVISYGQAKWRKYIQFINEEKSCLLKLIYWYTVPKGILKKDL